MQEIVEEMATQHALIQEAFTQVDPIFWLMCQQKGLAYDVRYGKTPWLASTPRYYNPNDWPPEDYWVSDLGTVYQWDGEHFIVIGETDPPRPNLPADIMRVLAWERADPVERTLAEHGYVSPPPLPDGGTDWPEAARRMLDTPHRTRVTAERMAEEEERSGVDGPRGYDHPDIVNAPRFDS